MEQKLDDRMKDYERTSRYFIDTKDNLIVRLDGHHFSSFTKGFKKPFDTLLSDTMIETSQALMEEFTPSSVYTQSDEISLVFPAMYLRELERAERIDSDVAIAVNKETGEEFNIEHEWEEDEMYPIANIYIGEESYFRQIKYGQCNEIGSNYDEALEKYDFFYETLTNNQIFGGRIDKIVSLMASKATLSFNKIFIDKVSQYKLENASKSPLVKRDEDEYIEMLESKILKATFDGRAFGVPSDIEAFNAILFRMRDAEKNSKSMFAGAYCSHKELLNLTGEEKIAFCIEKNGKDWNDIRPGFKYGFLLKKEEYEIDVDMEKYPKSENTKSIRTRTVILEEKYGFSDENVELIISKRISYGKTSL